MSLDRNKIQDLYPFKENYLDIDGLKYHYVDEGEGEAVVMVHGNPTWSFFYRDLIKKLSPNYRCIAVDHIGCGFSDKPQDYAYTLENHIQNLTKLIEHLGLKKINLVVHDWGGAIGMGYATRHLDNVNKITVFNTAAFLSKNIPFRISLCKNAVFGKFIVRAFNAFAGPATFMTTQTPLSPQVKEAFLMPYHNWETRIATHEFVRDIPLKENHRTWKTLKGIEDKLSEIKDEQILICWGKHDFCFNDSFLQTWKQKFPTAECHEFEAGHYLMEDKLDEIFPYIEQKLK